ncbi:MAG TPA: hypothetical protein VGC22_13960, partial [Chitinophaga sp.]
WHSLWQGVFNKLLKTKQPFKIVDYDEKDHVYGECADDSGSIFCTIDNQSGTANPGALRH